MYNGKFNKKNRRLRWRREFVLLCSILVLLIGMVGGTLAYLITNTDPVTNTFTAPEIDVTIPEDFDDGDKVKSNVKVKNQCDFEVYARATYVAYWQNASGEVYSETPDVSVEIGASWTNMSDGYYLYGSKVAAGAETGYFIVTAQLAEGETAPSSDYTLVIDVIGEVVQAEPEQAIKDVWGYDAPDAG